MPFTYFLSILLGAAGAWFVESYANKFGIIDCPSKRSSHIKPTPKGGGIGLVFVFILSAIASGVPTFVWTIISMIALIALGSDRFDIPAKIRLILQTTLIIGIVAVKNAVFNDAFIFQLIIIMFWAFYMVGTANMYNFMDGINGIAAVNGIIAFTSLVFFLKINNGSDTIQIILICMSLGLIGFLPFNFPKARVFMGDVGSILLGIVFAASVCFSVNSFIDFVYMSSFLYTFYFDEIVTMAIRIYRRENLLRPHRLHCYQMLANELNVKHWKVTLIYGAIQMVVSGIVLISSYYKIYLLYFIGFSAISILCSLGYHSIISMAKEVDRKKQAAV